MGQENVGEDFEEVDNNEDMGGERGLGGAGAPTGAGPAYSPKGYFSVAESQSKWYMCPNCGDKMSLKYDSGEPTIEYRKYVFTHIWVCKHCWTTVDRVVRIPAE